VSCYIRIVEANKMHYFSNLFWFTNYIIIKLTVSASSFLNLVWYTKYIKIKLRSSASCWLLLHDYTIILASPLFFIVCCVVKQRNHH
jgi:hypothetical protein